MRHISVALTARCRQRELAQMEKVKMAKSVNVKSVAAPKSAKPIKSAPAPKPIKSAPAPKPVAAPKPVKSAKPAAPDAKLSPTLKAKLARLGFQLMATASTMPAGPEFNWLEKPAAESAGLWTCTRVSDGAVVFVGSSNAGLRSRVPHVLQMANRAKSPAERSKQRGCAGCKRLANRDGTTRDQLVNRWDEYAGAQSLLVHVKIGNWSVADKQAAVDAFDKPPINRTVAGTHTVEPSKPAAKPAAVTKAAKPAATVTAKPAKAAKPAAVTVKPATKKPATKPEPELTAKPATVPAGKLVKAAKPAAKPEPVAVTVVPVGKSGKPAKLPVAAVTAKHPEPKTTTRARARAVSSATA